MFKIPLFIALITFAISASAQLQTAPTPLPAPATAASNGIAQMALGLIVVLGLIAALAWLLKRVTAQKSFAANTLRIISSASVGQRERVVLVEIGDTWLVLGVAPGNVRALHTLPKTELAVAMRGQSDNPVAQGNSFAEWLKKMAEKRS